MPKLRPETRSERRHALLEAAWRCAAERGFRDLTVDDVCAQARMSKGAFYGYFEQKQDLLLALLDADDEALARELATIDAAEIDGPERLRRFARVMHARGDDAARVQVRADLWAHLLTEPAVRERVAAATHRRRIVIREWIEQGTADGSLVEIPANALASILLALGDGLLLQGALDRGAFRWENVGLALDVLIDGITAR